MNRQLLAQQHKRLKCFHFLMSIVINQLRLNSVNNWVGIDYTILFLKLLELDDNTMVIQAPLIKNFSYGEALFKIWRFTAATMVVSHSSSRDCGNWHLSSQRCDTNSEFNMKHLMDFWPCSLKKNDWGILSNVLEDSHSWCKTC